MREREREIGTIPGVIFNTQSATRERERDKMDSNCSDLQMDPLL